MDLVGCGRSDKPARRSDYTLARHEAWLSQWLESLDLRDITLYCQDWGGTLGLTLVTNLPERFSRVVASNTGICEFPMLIAVQPDNPGLPINLRVWDELARFDKPFLTLWGKLDPVAPGGDRQLQQQIPGAQGQPHHVFENASHFIQEDVPEQLVERIASFIEAS